MKGLLSIVLFAIAFVQVTVAAPVVSENSSAVSKRDQKKFEYLIAEPETEDSNVEKRGIRFAYIVAEPETEDSGVEKRELNLERRYWLKYAYLTADPQGEDSNVESAN